MKLSIPILALGMAWATGAPLSVLAQAEKWPESGTVIVIASDATIEIAEKEPRSIATASVLEYSRTNETWLWIDALWGWIDRSDVVLLEDAEKHYTAIIEAAKAADEPTGVAYHQRGIARLALGQTEEALKDFDAAIAAEYLAASVYINRGQTLALMDRHNDAVESLTEAIAKEPENGIAYDSRAVVLASQDFLDAAMSDAERAVELSPSEARVWYDRGLLYQRKGNFKEAISDYNEALKISPRYSEAVTNRGYCLKRLGRFADAAKDYEKALSIRPNQAIASNDLAWLLATCRDKSVRDPKKAVQLAKNAVDQTDGSNGTFLDTLAAAYAAAGQWKAAEKTARAAVEKLDGADQFAADQRLSLYLEQKPYIEE